MTLCKAVLIPWALFELTNEAFFFNCEKWGGESVVSSQLGKSCPQNTEPVWVYSFTLKILANPGLRDRMDAWSVKLLSVSWTCPIFHSGIKCKQPPQVYDCDN